MILIPIKKDAICQGAVTPGCQQSAAGRITFVAQHATFMFITGSVVGLIGEVCRIYMNFTWIYWPSLMWFHVVSTMKLLLPLGPSMSIGKPIEQPPKPPCGDLKGC